MKTGWFGIITVASLLASVAASEQYPPGPGGSCPDTLTITQVQNPSAPCHPAVLDTVLGVMGIVTGFDRKATAFALIIQQPGESAWAGVNVATGNTDFAAPPYGVQLGDLVAVYGKTQEFQSETQIEGLDLEQSTNDLIVRVVSPGHPLPAPILGTPATFERFNPLIEPYEGMLVGIDAPTRVARTSTTGGLPFNSFLLVADEGAATDSVLIDGFILTTYSPPPAGTRIASVRGIVAHRSFQSETSYRIQLRDANDIEITTPVRRRSWGAVKESYR